MTNEYFACLQTVPFRKGDVWYYETGIRRESNRVMVVIDAIDFGVTENGTRAHMFGRYLDDEGTIVSAPIPLFDFNFVEKVGTAVEEVAA